VRCVSADRGMLVSGGSDATIRCWWALPNGDAPNAACPFLLSGVQPVKLSGSSAHTAPITSLQLLEQHMYSGSWDMTVRCWQRTDRSLQPSAVWVSYPHQPGTTSPVWNAVKHVDVYLCLVSYGQTCCLSLTRNVFGGDSHMGIGCGVWRHGGQGCWWLLGRTSLCKTQLRGSCLPPSTACLVAMAQRWRRHTTDSLHSRVEAMSNC
jgi:hypothetical protein